MSYRHLALATLSLLLLSCSDDSHFDASLDAGLDGRPRQEAGGDSKPQPDGAPPVEECKNPPLTAPASGTCSVTAGSAAVLYRGAVLAPGKVLRNGHLLVEGGKVRCAACDCSRQPAATGATVVECAKGVISASLVNPHDHLGWTTGKPMLTDFRYDHRHEWRTGKNQKPEIKYPKSDYKTEPLLWGEARMLLGGTTAMLGEGGIKGLVRNLEKDNDGLGKPAVKNDTFPLGDSGGQMLAQTCAYPEIPLLSDVQGALAWVPHVAEGVVQEARNEFLCLSGQQAGGVDATQPNASYIHSVGLTTADVLDLARSSTGVVWSPRSNISLYGFTANVVQMDNLGVRIALGSDWVISGSMNMLRELACADLLNSKYYGGHFSDRQLFEMATVNAAASAGVADVIGQLTEGSFADVAIWNGAQRADYAAVVRAGATDVVMVLKAGVPVYGDEALVMALAPSAGQGCEALDVCGAPRRFCLQRETGKDLAALKAVVGDAYPLFFCDAPADEPTCVPSRPNEYTGAITATDSDGDGIPDDKDSCPKVFNPPRKLDGMKQPDTDGDKVGDECDVCPLDANTAVCSTTPKPNDKDSDGVTDDKDNCPTLPNKGQEDADQDGIGDVCDACAKPNPGGTACPFAIRELRDRSLGLRPADGTLVKLKGGVVIGVRTTKTGNYGFYLREGTGPFEAVFVFTKSAKPSDAGGALLKLGDRIDLAGKIVDYSGLDEIESPAEITVTGSGDISPVPVKTADLKASSASGEAQESQLVRVSGVKVAAMVGAATTTDAFWVSDDGSDCSGATPACTQVGDFFYDGSVVNGQPTATVSQTFTSITGVLNGFKSAYTLEPRDAADLVP